MALTIGTDSYVTVAEANAYHTANNNAGWTGTDGVKEAALRYATRYVDKKYQWIGMHSGSPGQPLSWPRLDAYDSDGKIRVGIPQEVKDAVCEMALSHIVDGSTLPSKDRGGQIEQVKAGSVEVKYTSGAPSNRTYPMVDLIVSKLLAGSGATIKLVRG